MSEHYYVGYRRHDDGHTRVWKSTDADDCFLIVSNDQWSSMSKLCLHLGIGIVDLDDLDISEDNCDLELKNKIASLVDRGICFLWRAGEFRDVQEMAHL